MTGDQGIYFDYAATTPVAPEVAKAMGGFLTLCGVFGNPSSVTHGFGARAAEAVEEARWNVAELIGARAEEIYWTSGATEAINLAMKGAMLSPLTRGRHVLVSALEHKAVLDTADWLAGAGFNVTFIYPDQDGEITPDAVAAEVRGDTALVSVMHVNNEVGTVTDVAAIARVLRDTDVLLHVDAAQSAARMSVDVSVLEADMLSLSGHKIYGPKGVGALYVQRNLQAGLVAQTHGGGQERGLRPGTLPTHQIVGMGRAAQLVRARMDEDAAHVATLDDLFLHHVSRIDGAVVNGGSSRRAAGIVNLAFPGVEAEALMLALGDIAVSAGSACTAAAIEPSHVLQALGIDEDVALASVRFSFGRYTTLADVDIVCQRVERAVSTLRSIAA